MSANIANHMHPIAPIRVIQHRIERDLAASKPLEGLQWFNRAQIRVDGADDFPNIAFIEYSSNEDIGPGSMQDQLISAPVTVSLMLSTWADNGFYAVDAENDEYGLVDWVLLIQESLERDDNDDVDYTLDGTLAKPFTFTVQDSGITDLSYAQAIDITYLPKHFRRGTRSDLFSTL